MHRLQKIGGFYADLLCRELLRIPCDEDVRDIGSYDGIEVVNVIDWLLE